MFAEESSTPKELSSLMSTKSNSRVEHVRRTISPYDLTSGDNPGILISQPLLRGSNYDEWSANLRLALQARKKFGFVDGSILRPDDDSEDLEDWCANNALVISWIKLTISETLRSSIPHSEDSHELWLHLQRRFSVKNGQRVQRLKTELANCRQKGIPIETYYGQLTKLWTSLSDFQRAKTPMEIQKEREEDKLHQFLMGLDDSVYGVVKSNLLSRDPLPTIDEAYNVLIQDKESKRVSHLNEECLEGLSFAVQTSQQSRPMTENRAVVSVCTYCGKQGHLVEQCFRKIGYPPWFDKTKTKSSSSYSRMQTEQNGAIRSKRPTDTARVNQVLSTSVIPPHLNASDRVGISGLSDTQWQTLVRMLDERKPSLPDRLTGTYFLESWIIDSGASNHMTGCLDYLTEVSDMAPILIKLPNGSYTTSYKHGKVKLSSSLDLCNVFYVDGLHCHLISVSQLTKDKGCVFQITDRLCVVQDRITRMLIGAGEQLNGLYFLRGVAVAAAMQGTSLNSSELWHCRFGHPSSQSLDMLHLSDFSVDGFDSKSCDVCIRAKQTRDSFSLSINKTVSVFELIHCDLWGPYRTTSLCGSRYFFTIVDDFSRAVCLHLLPSKHDVSKILKNFIALVERQFSGCVKRVRSDNGTEFVCLSEFFAQKGIVHETSCVGTPQQNGRVERKHRHILNVARALRFHSHLPTEFWGYCALAASYLINRTPTKLLHGKTPFELIYNRAPPLQHLRVFGCLCYVHNQKHGGDKFASRSIPSIFVGYPFAKKGW